MFSGLFAGIFGGGAAAAPKPPVAVATGYIPAYANGCLPNYATGGGYQRAMQSEASQDIGTPFLAVINSRESVLSAKNGDSQAYAEMVKNGSWDEVKAQYGNSSYQQTNIDKLVTNNSFSQGANYQDTKMDKLVMNLSKGSISYSSSAMPNLSGGYIPNFASGRIASGYSSNYSSMPTSNVSSNSNQTSNSNVKIVTNQNINYNIAKENAKGLSESQIRKAEKQAQTKASRIV
jgi:hypothetical protein